MSIRKKRISTDELMDEITTFNARGGSPEEADRIRARQDVHRRERNEAIIEALQERLTDPDLTLLLVHAFLLGHHYQPGAAGFAVGLSGMRQARLLSLLERITDEFDPWDVDDEYHLRIEGELRGLKPQTIQLIASLHEVLPIAIERWPMTRRTP